ncbi:ANTAR domain-containing protein [Arthrobacter cheniae]|uniref:ANTAR domain-containing protein n=1 Tax=Arthrobacter cheniae TaxID=1258888 RepID=A0A3A5LWW9_9MICC|nr:GAF and ANTAR domain-containing protein [Arthrobacter cheniae]RJT75095.1 ANTAR domain-containing protein [Arthrobacter cheniae]
MSDAPQINPQSAPQIDELGVIIGRTKGFLLTEQTVQDAVDALAEVARDVIIHADGAGVSLIRDGDRTSVGATDAKVLEADNLQYTLGEGPCLSSWATNQSHIIADTETDTRWKRWAATAATAGVRSCLSVPLIRGMDTIGAMKVYAGTPDAFTTDDQRLLVNLAKSAAALLGHVQASDTPQRISDEVSDSLRTRDTVGIARGILMERHDLGRDEALARITALSSETNTPVSDLTATIAERKNGIDPSEAS